MRKIDELFSEYGESHRDKTNKMLHFIYGKLGIPY